MNDWNSIRAHYQRALPKIMAEQRNEWGIDPYAWEGVGVKMTPIESALWADIRQAGAVFYPQFPVLRYFVDFANPIAQVAIECDGRKFHTDPAKDEERDAHLHKAGWTVYRIGGRECLTDSDACTGSAGFALKFVSRIAAQHGLSSNPEAQW